MKKLLIIILVLIAFIVGGIYFILFTSSGNALLKPIIQKELSKKLPIEVSLDRFRLSPVDIVLHLGKESKIVAKGELHPFSQSFDIDYDVKIARLEDLKALTKQNLRGPLHTKGHLFGKVKEFEVQGTSDVAKSDTSYDIHIEDFEPTDVLAKIDHAQIADLLYMVSQPRVANGRLDLDANLSDLDPEHLAGLLKAKIRQGRIDAKVIKKAFKVNVPSSSLQGDVLAKLHGSDIDLKSLIDSSLLKLALTGTINTKKMATNMQYDLSIQELALLEPMTGAPLRGPFDAKGKITGDKLKMRIDGVSHLAGSNTNYKVTLKHLKPALADLSINKGSLAKLLYMLGQPQYADGRIDSTVHLTSLDPKTLSGQIDTKISQGMTNPRVLDKEFGFKNARIDFSLIQKSAIKKGKILSDITLDSSVAKVTSKGALVDLGDMSVKAGYEVFVPDLSRLYFATKQRMRGSVKIAGVVEKRKDLLVTAHSNTLGGSLDMKLLNDDLQAKLKDIKVVELTHMLYYPKVFDSTMDATLDYNIVSKKGELLAKAFDGRILPNQMTFLLKQMANFDITKEIYKLTELNSTIEGDKILSDLDMKSRLTHISSKKALVDLAKEYIDAKLRIDIRKKPVIVKIKGKLTSPNVSIDAKSLFKQKAKKELQKRLKGKLPGKIEGLMKMF